MEDKCPTDQPEAYAPNYLHSEEHVQLFEKCKLLHDEAQKKGLVFFLIMQSPDKEAMLPISLFHLMTEPGKLVATCREDMNMVVGNFNWLMKTIGSFYTGITNQWKGLFKDQEGEEWKNER